ncbi:hypothetical protein KEM48_010685 [Puccinia striiformis f. sp. tritici PST-130]|nr:hypothetical protein KEM48_010685 [Puccinia striiformis f. sp. tritici PST-130]
MTRINLTLSTGTDIKKKTAPQTPTGLFPACLHHEQVEKRLTLVFVRVLYPIPLKSNSIFCIIADETSHVYIINKWRKD